MAALFIITTRVMLFGEFSLGPTLIAAACDVPEAVIYLAKTGKDCAVTRYNSGNLLATATNRNLRHAKDGKTAAALKEVLAGWSPERHALHNPWFRKAVHVMLLVQQRLRLQAAPPGFAGFDGSAAAATYPDSDFRLEPWSRR
eukprot:gene3847-19728_t